MCKKLIKNSQPFGKKFQKTAGGIFFDSHCRVTPRILMWSDNETEQPATSTEREEAPGVLTCQVVGLLHVTCMCSQPFQWDQTMTVQHADWKWDYCCHTMDWMDLMQWTAECHQHTADDLERVEWSWQWLRCRLQFANNRPTDKSLVSVNLFCMMWVGVLAKKIIVLCHTMYL